MLRILVVDDDPELCTLLSHLLRQYGLAVETVPDGPRGLALARQGPFDLVILDVNLPDINGFEVLERLRRHSAVPVIMLTAWSEKAERVHGLHLGADDYLPKPFDPDELHARILAIHRRSQRTSGGVLREGLLCLLPDERDAVFGGQRLGLTAMEYEILERLMRSPGRAVSRDEISVQLYNRQASPYDRSVDTHVTRIRRKLGAGRGMIRSVRGTGYQLCSTGTA